MATYNGELASNGLPALATEGTVDFGAMTLARAQHVNLRRASGDEFDPEAEPGSSPDMPCYVQPITDAPQLTRTGQATLDNSAAFIVSNTISVKLASVNSARKSLLIVNCGPGSLYVDNTSAVASSGPSLGKLIQATGGSYSDSGEGVSVGEVWGIYSASSAVQNVSVSDRS